MIHAALDTSISCSLVIADDDTVLFRGTLESASRDNDKKLPPWVRDTLKNLGLSPDDVRRWTVGTGPGSFAGLRAGIAFILGIAYATGASVRGVPSAIATAAQAHVSDEERVGVLMDGRCGEVILIPVKGGAIDGEPAALTPEQLLQPENACNCWITPQPTLLPELPDAIKLTLKAADAPDPAVLLFEKRTPFSEGTAGGLASCEPIYVRPPVFVSPVAPRVVP